jgi:hypothetical protein
VPFKNSSALNNKLYNTNRMEKQLLREAFNGCINGTPYLPIEILMRKKEAFSDGVSDKFDGQITDNWISSIKQFCNEKYSDMDFELTKIKYIYNRPTTKEELYYRETFCNFFNPTPFNNTSELTVKMWKPNWCDNNNKTKVDPSAREHIIEQFN